MRKCHICGNDEMKVVYSNMPDKSYFIPGKFTLLRCTKCGMEFTDPLMSEEEAGKYYPADKYYSFKNKNKLGLLYHQMSAYYYSKKNPLFTAIFYAFKSLFYTYYIDPGKKLLEIGCGDGLKLKIYKDYGLDVYGLEPYGPDPSEEQKKLKIEKKTIHQADYKADSFDYIVMKEVLEHVPNQQEVLSKCLYWLKPSGKLIITIPNTAGFWNKIFKDNWFGYDVSRHPYHYNPRTISAFLKKIGFKINIIRQYDPPYMLAGSLKYYFNNPKLLGNFFKVLFTLPCQIITYLDKGSLMEIECTK